MPMPPRFDGQKSDEKVILMLHRHWATLAWPIFTTSILFLFPIFVWIWLFVRFVSVQFLAPYAFIFGLFWCGIGLLTLAYRWFDWHWDRYIVSDQRVIDIDQNGLFHREVHETSLAHVQEVYYEVKGILATLLNYGNVQVLTGGPSGDLVFENVAEPKEVQRIILQEANRFNEEYGENPATAEDLLRLLLEHEHNRKNQSKEGISSQSSVQSIVENLPEQDVFPLPVNRPAPSLSLTSSKRDQD